MRYILGKVDRQALRFKDARVSPFCPDNLAALMGPAIYKTNPISFIRKLSILDLEEGYYSGNCKPVDALEIVVSEKGRILLDILLG